MNKHTKMDASKKMSLDECKNLISWIEGHSEYENNSGLFSVSEQGKKVLTALSDRICELIKGA